MSAFIRLPLAVAGRTGNNNEPSVSLPPQAQLVAVEFVVEAVGATPTITYKLQGSFDLPQEANDASANWWDIIALPSDNETAAISKTVTATGAYATYIAQSTVRFATRVRLATSANTNVTYHAYLRTQYRI